MSIDLLLRALRKCESVQPTYTGSGAFFPAEYKRNQLLADKIHKKIVERFEKMKQAGKELYLDKIVREQEENLRHVGDEA